MTINNRERSCILRLRFLLQKGELLLEKGNVEKLFIARIREQIHFQDIKAVPDMRHCFLLCEKHKKRDSRFGYNDDFSKKCLLFFGSDI